MRQEEPIRVLCVFARLDFGGAETMCMNLYRNLDRNRIQFDFVKHTPEKCAYEDEIIQLGGRVYEAPVYRIYNHAAYCSWWKHHLKAHPEHRIIHGHYFTIASVYFRIAKKLGRITVGHSHIAYPNRIDFRDRLKDSYCKRVEKYSDYAFACGTEAGKWLFPGKEFVLMNNAIPAGQFAYNSSIRSTVRKELGIENGIAAGTVGRFHSAKNPYGTLEIMKRVHSMNPDVKLLWVGDGEMRDDIENEIRKNDMSSYMVLTGCTTDVSRLMQAMDVFILPSIFEGLPTVAIEAQAAGLPCLISDTVSKETDITGL